MKRHMTSALALAMLLCLAAFAADNKKETMKDSGKTATVSGWVTDPACGRSGKKDMLANAECTKKCAKDGKYVIVTDGDNKVWAVDNSEILKGHEGHHVKVTGQPNADAGTIHIATVAMMKDQTPPTGAKSDKPMNK